jgi:hypothetical protein
MTPMRKEFNYPLSSTASIHVSFDLEYDGSKPVISNISIHSNFGSELPKHPTLDVYEGRHSFRYEFDHESGKRLIGHSAADDKLANSIISEILHIAESETPQWLE